MTYEKPQITRLLTFRLRRAEFLALDRRFLWVGIIATWIVGMGRYWDDPGAKLLQHLGLGSVIYIFALSLLIYLVVWPFRRPDWTYLRVLTFVSLTSFPAILYAIPVERFFEMSVAATMNVWFLAIVAAWRLALLFYFLAVLTRLPIIYMITSALLPVVLIIVVLTALNLERAVFNIMAGIEAGTANDEAYAVLVSLTVVSIYLAPILLLVYGIGVHQERKKRLSSGQTEETYEK